MFAYLLQGLTLGLAAGTQPGPFQTYIISQSLRQGWRKTLIAAIAPLVSDGPIVTLVLLVLSQIPNWFQRLLQIAGGLFVLFLAWGAYKAWRGFSPERINDKGSGRQSLLQAGLMNALSPGPYLFWSFVNGPIVIQAWRETPAHALNFLFGFYGGMIALNAAIILLFGLAARFGDRVRRGLLGASSLALAGFGIFQLWRGIFLK
jgi:threonine/homoserine/homoserine lactone efflux protein